MIIENRAQSQMSLRWPTNQFKNVFVPIKYVPDNILQKTFHFFKMLITLLGEVYYVQINKTLVNGYSSKNIKI